MEQLAPHEKVFVDPRQLAQDAHGDMGCHECHRGDPSDPDWVTAHDGVVRDPSFPPQASVCAECHEEQSEHYGTSLHATLAPFAAMTALRASGDSTDPVDRATRARVELGRENHCTSCHSSCGQCHVSRPTSVDGGLLDGHRFLTSPPTRNVCTACHGSRVEHEYFGKNPGMAPDIHQQLHMRCRDCHTGQEMHGESGSPDNRYAVANAPRCVKCHEDIFDAAAPNAAQHRQHRDRVSCQACHAQPYKHCVRCHFGRDEHGYKYFKNEKTWLDLKIGLSPLRSAHRPETFVTLRHVPVDQESFRFYAPGGLAGFDQLPTWKLTTPHNIRRQTVQNRQCANCHGRDTHFLRLSDVEQKYRAANARVAVPDELLPLPLAMPLAPDEDPRTAPQLIAPANRMADSLPARESVSQPLATKDSLLAACAKVTREIDVDRAGVLFDTDAAVFLDCREPREFRAGHVPGALSAPRGSLEFDLAALVPDKNTPIVIYCRSGGRGCLAAETLTHMGYASVLNLRGGWLAWDRAWLPVQ